MANKTLQLDILERFMTEQQLADFLKKYKLNVHRGSGAPRGISLMTPVLPEDISLLKDYFNQEMSVGTIVQKYDIAPASIYGKIGRVSQRYLYQNRTKIGL